MPMATEVVSMDTVAEGSSPLANVANEKNTQIKRTSTVRVFLSLIFISFFFFVGVNVNIYATYTV
jgi:hypothetical protein